MEIHGRRRSAPAREEIGRVDRAETRGEIVAVADEVADAPAGQSVDAGRRVVAEARQRRRAPRNAAARDGDVVECVRTRTRECVESRIEMALRRSGFLIAQRDDAGQARRAGGSAAEREQREPSFGIQRARAALRGEAREITFPRRRRQRHVGRVAALRARHSGTCLPGRRRQIHADAAARGRELRFSVVIERLVPRALGDVADRGAESLRVRRAEPVEVRIRLIGEFGAADAGDVAARAQDVRA